MHSQDLGDYIGAESCVDFKPYVADGDSSHGGAAMSLRRCPRRRDAAEKKFPPAIPSLALAESQPLHVMKKYCTSDGRLVIREERVKRRELFQAHRSDGRLRLNLVPVDDEEEAFDSTENLEIDGGGERINVEEVIVGVNPCGGFAVARGGVPDAVFV